MGVKHSKQSCDISSTPKKNGEVNGKGPVEAVKPEEKITVSFMTSYESIAIIFTNILGSFLMKIIGSFLTNI